ncbi:hypothetical protein CBM2626_U50003 [Cupriavidus taiwanensis]|nr:hypothetical protein CBM2626_U50003 [Cupriavidus taiwanensis]SPA57724.1 hypothetical protein CBM2638_U40004 [Cupriavidus taiwanensis]
MVGFLAGLCHSAYVGKSLPAPEVDEGDQLIAIDCSARRTSVWTPQLSISG